MSGSPVWQSIAKRAAEGPERPWLTVDEQRFTWGEALAAINRVANFLNDVGVSPGDHVAMMLGNRPEIVWTHLGTLAVGAVPVPINVRQRGAALRYLLDDCDAACLVIDAAHVDAVSTYLEEIDRYRCVVVVGGSSAVDLAGVDTVVGWGAVESSSADTPTALAPSGGFDRTMNYTSGTTGPPKGVIPIQRDGTTRERLLAALDVKPGETMYTTLPLFHGNAMTTILNSVALDARVVVAGRFSASNFWHECRRHQAVLTNTIGGMVTILLKQPPGPHDRAHGVRRVLSAGAPRERWQEFEHRFGVELIEFYGMVDSAGLLLNDERRIGSMGTPIGGVEFRVVDDNDHPVDASTIGELVIRHPQGVMREYYKQPELTAEANRGGWFHTGDLASIDGDGFFYYEGRKKDSIRRGGENISAWEVESVIDMHEAVEASAAYGVKSEIGEQDLMVAIVPKGEPPNADDIRQFCVGRIADYAMPRYIRFVDRLPRTGTHRIQKSDLVMDGVTPDAIDLQAERAR